jgi:formylglycine-generating enzyme required for sulfatase activity
MFMPRRWEIDDSVAARLVAETQELGRMSWRKRKPFGNGRTLGFIGLSLAILVFSVWAFMPQSGFLKGQSPSGSGLFPPESTAILGERNMTTIQDRLTTVVASATVAFAAISFAPTAPQAQAQSCSGDINGDNLVNGVDLAQVLTDWGACGIPAPIISSVTPSFGPAAGGTAITILGSSLSTVTSVTIGGVAATNVVVVSATVVTAVAPAGTGGAKNVVVITPNSSATAIGAFTYSSGLAWATVLEWIPNQAVVTDANLRAAITASGLPWRVLDNGTNIEMLLVPGGTFMMGCSPGDAECFAIESPVHQVTLTNAFYIGKTEVTQAQWVAKMGSNPSYFQGQSDSPSRPVEQVSWNMIQGFNTVTSLRLPTEAEWEFACRAGTMTARYGVFDDIAWHDTNSGGATHAVATKLPNALGLYDTIGNDLEWCQDWYGPYASGGVTNPTGPTTGTVRLLRGGHWNNNSFVCRASERDYNTPGVTGQNKYGFRVARNP